MGQVDTQADLAGPFHAVQGAEEVVTPTAEQVAYGFFMGQHDPEPHREHVALPVDRRQQCSVSQRPGCRRKRRDRSRRQLARGNDRDGLAGGRQPVLITLRVM